MSMDVLQEKIRKKKNPALLCLDPTGQVIPPHLMEEALQEKGETLEAAALACENFCRGILLRESRPWNGSWPMPGRRTCM